MGPTHWISILLLMLPAAVGTASASNTIWVEGESAVRHNMQRNDWYDSVTKGSLSGGEWLSHFAEGTPPEAEFQFDVPEDGDYAFWIRANSVAGAQLSYRLDEGSWVEADSQSAIERLNIASDSKPDMRFISWMDMGRVVLKKGIQTIRFRFHSKNSNHGGLDCFVFTTKPFMPRGALKPGERTGKANPGYFAWEPDVDEFSSDALVNLSYLNEDIAGQMGYVRAEGNSFVLGNGKKVKFWGANAGPGIYGLNHASHIYLAKHLAKHGVNLVRLHGGLYGSRNPAFNMSRLDDLHHLVWALKQEGIYSVLSFYFPLWFQLDGDQRPFMLLYFDKQMQDIYFDWADKLLNTENPYIGVPLGREPAVAIVEVVNEDSHFFWTFRQSNMPTHRWENFTKLYGDWLTRKYGSIAAAIKAWGDVQEDGDFPAEGRMQLYGAWQMTTEGVDSTPQRRKRIGDQVQFLTENMRGFYGQAATFFREKCGYDGLVSCSNWHTADARMLDALERYCYTAGDVIDRHGYYGSKHQGDASSWSVRPGQTFASQSALDLKTQSPIPYVETEGYPHIISEIGWPMPNMYRAESAFLTATYGSLQGLDGMMHFAIGSAGWDQSVNKFVLNNPGALGSYFAAALVYRQGYVKEAPTLVMDNLELTDLYEMKGTNVHTRAALDQLRADDIPEGKEKRGAIRGIDPMTFYVGRVARHFNADPSDSMVKDVSKFIDREAKTIRSITDELAWDYGKAIATMNTPKAQGAAGFLGEMGAIDFTNVKIAMRNDYGTVMVVALDDRPLDDSKKILVQCMAIDQLYGWETSEPDGLSGTIQSVGSAPWGVQKFDTTITLRLSGDAASKITACDENGYPTERKVQSSVNGNELRVEIDPETAYTVIER